MTWLGLWGISAACVVVWWLIRQIRLRLLYDLHRVPTPPGSLPIVGHLLHVPRDPHPRFTQWAMEQTEKLGKIWKYNHGVQPSVIITDHEFFKANIYGPGSANESKPPLYRALNELFSTRCVPTIFTSEVSDDRHKAYRKTLAVAFSTENFKKKFPNMLQSAHKFANIANESVESKPIDFQDLGVRYAFENIGTFAYSTDFNTLENDHPLLSTLGYCTSEAMKDALNPLRKFSRVLFPFLESNRKNRSAFRTMHAEYQKVFDKLDLLGDDPDEEDKSIKACLMRLKNPLQNNRKATQDEIYAEFVGFVVAGTDTTGHQIGWTMMWIADNREIQDKIYAELKEHGLAGPEARELEYGDFANLTYLKMVIMEALRTTPSASTTLNRYLSKDMTIMGYRLPKGTFVSAFIQAQNNASWLWKDPDAFVPERWSKSDACKTGYSASEKDLWSFSTGTRYCIGRRLALLELHLVFALLLSKFTFELDPRMGGVECTRKMAYNSLVTACEGGMWVRATRRSHDPVSI